MINEIKRKNFLEAYSDTSLDKAVRLGIKRLRCTCAIDVSLSGDVSQKILTLDCSNHQSS